jgi:hypothetical protein
MRVIFYDVDGVLNCQTTDNCRNFPYVVDPILLDRFKSLVDRTGAFAVMSSTWRCDPVGLLAANHFGLPLDDICADLPGLARGEEIQRWLDSHNNVERFIVIDDECDGLGEFPLFQPSKATGLTNDLSNAAADYLIGNSDRTVLRPPYIRLLQNVAGSFKREKS